jgi:predicted transcriptional regulator
MADRKALQLTTDVVAAFLGQNRVSRDALPDLIRSIYGALSAAFEPEASAEPQQPSPAKIRASIKPDVLISFEDGRPYRMLKRHLRTHGLTPAQYREKWGLAADYPMVAPSYSASRSEVAKKMGFGKKGVQQRQGGKGRTTKR